MIKLRHIFLSTFPLLAVAATALEIQCGAGTLASALAGNRDATSLTVSGTLDASDLFFIADSLPGLTQLDISGATIVPYHGKKIKGSPVHPAAIPAGAFGGSKLKSISLPADISIGELAFASSGLKSITISGATRIGDAAFADCRELAETQLSADVRLGTYTFRNCTALKTVDLGGSVKVPDGTFAGCSALAELSGTENLAEIGSEAFLGTSALIEFPSSPRLARIGEYAFASSGIRELRLGENTTAIGKGAFFGCENLKEATLPSSLALMSDYMFAGCPLAALSIPSNLSEIGRFALKGTALVTVVLPSSLDAVGDGAMEDMQSLGSIDVRSLDAVPDTGADVWVGIDVSKVKLYVGADKAGFSNAPQWQDFDIDNDPGAVDSPLAPSGLHVRFANGILTIASDGSNIEDVVIFKLSGTPVASFTPDSQVCIADLSHLDKGSILVVAATLADGTRSTIKIAL